ncbi:MAG: RtcB family protein [Gemmatimonadetes bacterium]|nr:RtcB family protein [Gemmatimonadota bacterium]
MTHGPVRSWARDQYSTGAYEQARQAALAKGVVHPVALMPDAHVGVGACVGSVVATEGTIVPSCVGVDLGCGMSAVRLNCTAEDLPDTLGPVLAAFAGAVPPVAHSRHARRRRAEAELEALGAAPSGLADMGHAASQLGTLGSGNHFLEASLDRSNRVWIVVHSGSRGVGNYLARQHIRTAARLDTEAPSKDLAAFTADTPEFAVYVGDMLWAQDYAAANREVMLAAAVVAFEKATGLPITKCKVVDQVRCHHNYAERESRSGRELWITRKGAIRARVGDRGIIPGSMGASTFIVEGLGNPDSYCSASHGAGRTMSRRKAKEALSIDEMREQMADRVWLEDKAGALIDEAPDAYKDIHDVMAWQADLCAIEDELTAIVNYKGA